VLRYERSTTSLYITSHRRLNLQINFLVGGAYPTTFGNMAISKKEKRKMLKRYLAGCLLAGVFAVIFGCPPLAGAQGLALDPDWGVESLSVPSADQSGIDSYTKLVLHADGSDQGTSFTDSSSGAKTVTNTETYDSYTKLMLHMEGSGNSFTDSAASKTVTANGDVTQTTAQFKWGSSSTVFDGSGDYLSLADSDDWNFGSGDFTIDYCAR